MQTTADAIGLWPSPSEFAADIGVKLTLVNVWKHRKSIPPEHWAAVEEAARRRGINGVTASTLSKTVAAPRAMRRDGPPSAPVAAA